MLTLNGADLDYTVVDRATGTSDIIGMSIVTTTEVNSILTFRNPAGNSTALTIYTTGWWNKTRIGTFGYNANTIKKTY